MEPMGQCPVCDHKVAPTCQVCPQCGNTSWERTTGKRGEARVKTWCRAGHSYEERNKCSVCNEGGTIIERRHKWIEWVDTRSGKTSLSPDFNGGEGDWWKDRWYEWLLP